MTTLLVKVTELYIAGLLALLIARRASATGRHLQCVCIMAGSLLLPLAALLPRTEISLLYPINTSAVTSRALTKFAGLPARDLLLAFWAIGTVALLLRLAIGYWRIRQVTGSAELLEPGLYAADLNVPIASGLLQPKILMPRFAAEWPEWQRTAALRHERAHIERKDLLANFVAQLACALYWFHPLAWVLAVLQRRAQEEACDDAVLYTGFDPATYAEALLAVAQNSTSQDISSNLIPGCPMTTQTNVKDRIMRLLDSSIARTTSRVNLRRTAIGFAALLLTIGIQVQADQVYKMSDGVTPPKVIQKVDPQYTEDARRDKIAGTVLLDLVVGVDGMAHDINIRRNLDPGLDRKAVEAVQQWHFAPGTLKGEPVAVEAVIEINFRLQ
jgi:TonB family protein